MADYFHLPIYHESNVATHLLDSLKEDIQAEYDRREVYYDTVGPVKGRYFRKLSCYDENGVHCAVSGKDSMINISANEELQDICRQHACSYLEHLCHFPNIEYLQKRWATFSWWSCFDQKDSYAWHNHSQFLFSATYYIEMEEEHTPIAFRNPMGSILQGWLPGKMNPGLQEEIIIKPKAGDLLIWPGWLEHYVYNKSIWEVENQMPDSDYKLNYQKEGAGEPADYEIPEETEYKTMRKSITINYMKPADQFGFWLKNGINYE
tara:strand:+ start:1868 stop:2656 length:789 start_codon:yes stop_codon:yes gene_type:complete